MMQVMKDIGGVELPETLASVAGFDKQPEVNGKKPKAAPAPPVADQPAADPPVSAPAVSVLED